jgi:hypothetical protein
MNWDKKLSGFHLYKIVLNGSSSIVGNSQFYTGMVFTPAVQTGGKDFYVFLAFSTSMFTPIVT